MSKIVNKIWINITEKGKVIKSYPASLWNNGANGKIKIRGQVYRFDQIPGKKVLWMLFETVVQDYAKFDAQEHLIVMAERKSRED